MANNNGRITAPVNEYDVQYVLSENLGGDWARMCTYEGINMWAKYKPQRHSVVGQMTYDQRKVQHNGDGTVFGLVPSYVEQSDACKMNTLVHDIMTEQDDGWVYLKPRGFSYNEFYRIQDFVRNANDSNDPTGSGLQGYNQNAKVPFTAILQHEDDFDVLSDGALKINVAEHHSLMFTFRNNVGGDITIQEMINFFDNTQDYSWRPYVQLFRDSPTHQNVKWWQNTYNDTLVCDAVGAAIDTQSPNWSVTLPLDGLDFSFPQNRYHICIGVACCGTESSYANRHFKANNAVFVLPFSVEDKIIGKYPFYRMINIESHITRVLSFTGIAFNGGNTATWNSSAGRFEVYLSANGNMFFTFTVTKDELPLHFVRNSGQNPDTGYTKFRVKIIRQYEGVNTTTYLVPSTSNRVQKSDAYVPSGDPSETVTLYGNSDLNIGDLDAANSSPYSYYYVYANIGDDDNAWEQINSFTIYQYNSYS